MQPRLVEYLGFDPFVIAALGRPKGNETHGVAFLSPDRKLALGQQILHWRIGLKKTHKLMVAEMGVSIKPL